MTTYQLATDGDDEPCLFFHRDTYPHWQPVLRRCDLAVSARHLWDDVAAAVVAASVRPVCKMCDGKDCPDCKTVISL